jgi:hypothetical protein
LGYARRERAKKKGSVWVNYYLKKYTKPELVEMLDKEKNAL